METLTLLLDHTSRFFTSISDVIWVALIAPAFTIIGIWFNNRHHTNLQQNRLDHERDQNEEDRKLALRRDIYLKAVEDLTHAQHHLMGLANFDPESGDSADKYNNFFVAAGKACLVASDKTSKALSDLVDYYAEVFLELIAKTVPIHDVKTDRDLANSSYERHQNEIDRLLAEITQFYENGKTDSSILATLNSNFEFHKKQSAIELKDRTEAWKKLNLLQNEFRKHAFSKMKEMSELTIPALVAIRAELGIESDLTEYLQEAKSRHKKFAELLDKLTNELEALEIH